MSVKATNAYVEIVDGGGNQIDSTHPLYISPATGTTSDVSDRAARDLGKVDVAGIDAVGTIAGQKAMVASIPVVIASDQTDVNIGIADGDNVAQGAKADAAVTDPTASASVIAALKGILTDIGVITSSAVVDPTASGNLNALLKGIMADIGPIGATAVIDPAAAASMISVLKGLLTLLGLLTATAVTDPTASGSINANIKGLLALLTTSYLSTTVSVVIAESASLSAYFDKRGYSKISIEMPAAWTAADLSFVGCSTSGGTYVPVYAEDGIEITMPTSTSRIATVGINDGALASIPYLKVRSGTVGTTVVQTAARTLTVLMSR